MSDYREKVIYLYGFQSACPGCHRKGFPTLLRLIDHYEGNDEVVFLAVQTAFEGYGVNSAERAQTVADDYGLKIPVGHSGSVGNPSQVMMQYRTGGTPWTILIDRNGRVRANDYHFDPEQIVSVIDSLLADPLTNDLDRG